MSKINCPCGYQMSDVCYPYKQKGIILSEAEVDSLEDLEQYAKKNIPQEFLSETEVILNGKEIWECPECGRLAIIIDDLIGWYKCEIPNKRLFV